MDFERARARRFIEGLERERQKEAADPEVQADRLLAALRRKPELSDTLPADVRAIPARTEKALNLQSRRDGGGTHLLGGEIDPRQSLSEYHASKSRDLASKVRGLTPIQRLVLLTLRQEVDLRLFMDFESCMDTTSVADALPRCRSCASRPDAHFSKPKFTPDDDEYWEWDRWTAYQKWQAEHEHVFARCWSRRRECVRRMLSPAVGVYGRITEAGLARMLGVKQQAVSKAREAARKKLIAYAQREDQRRRRLRDEGWLYDDEPWSHDPRDDAQGMIEAGVWSGDLEQ